ncbi:aldo/keto reductase [Candidatus Mycoplasma haematobovis]|uniref:Aldo/keto reductase n=2 Tax=Candidatus Mycoplasma haematobovis TaxID=432608 RepID=A0A1A9QDK7_9MOLU|nr:aldo/keto reductase [Candidatus Mycoplasma haematobovis]
MALKDLKKEDMSFEFKVPFQSKVWPTKFTGGINKSIKFALAKIGANDYMDSYLLHAPATEKDKNINAWKQLIDCRKRGQTKKIGLGDFSIEEIESLFNNTDIRPDILQLPLNINNMHEEYYVYCRDKGIEVQSYRPFGDYEKNKSNKQLIELAQKYNTNIKNLLIAYLLNIGITVIVMPENKEEISEFPKAKLIVLEVKDLELLSNIK